MTIDKAVIPAAGFGTRFLPAAKAVPKEMLAVVDKPMIQYVVEEAVASGIRQVGIVISRWKSSIERHFGPGPELEEFLRDKGKEELAAEVARVGRPAQFTFIDQPQQRGLGHAILMAEPFAAGRPFAVLNPDTIYDGDVPCLRQLLSVFDDKRSTVVVLGRIDRDGMSKYGVVRAKHIAGRVYEVEDLAEKPGPDRAMSDLAVLGRYVFMPGIFEALRKTPPGAGGEVQVTDAIRLLLEKEPVFGVLFEGRRFDAGDKFGFLEATIHLALQRPEFRDRLRELLRALNEDELRNR